MTTPAPTLHELQRAIGRDLLHGVPAEASTWVIADGIDPQARLGIYGNTAAGTLAKALRLSYPCVELLVGAEFFDWAARLFIEERPPISAWLDEYGAGFADFLERLPQAASLAYLTDVARLEWIITSVLHAPEVPPLDLERVARMPPAELGHAAFKAHPATRLVRSDFPVDTIWRAVLARDDGAMAAIDPADGPVWLHVHRSATGADLDRMSEAEWRFAEGLFAGRPLREVLDQVPLAEAHALLAGLLAAGCFAGIAVERRPL